MDEMRTLKDEVGRRARYLGKRETRRLIRKARKGDQEASDTLFWAVAKMAIKMGGTLATRYRCSQEDCISAGFQGILECIYESPWDAKRDVAWVTYACFWIRRAILLQVARTPLVQIPLYHFWDAGSNNHDANTALKPVAILFDTESYMDDQFQNVEKRDMERRAVAMVDAMPMRDRRIMRGTMLEGLTLDKVASEFSVSRQAICARRQKLMDEMREAL